MYMQLYIRLLPTAILNDNFLYALTLKSHIHGYIKRMESKSINLTNDRLNHILHQTNLTAAHARLLIEGPGGKRAEVTI